MVVRGQVHLLDFDDRFDLIAGGVKRQAEAPPRLAPNGGPLQTCIRNENNSRSRRFEYARP